jgi:hypothetical protein
MRNFMVPMEVYHSSRESVETLIMTTQNEME